MKDASRTVAIDAFPDSAFRRRGSDAIACIDVMLATTTLVTTLVLALVLSLILTAAKVVRSQVRTLEGLHVCCRKRSARIWREDRECGVDRVRTTELTGILGSPLRTDLIADGRHDDRHEA